MSLSKETKLALAITIPLVLAIIVILLGPLRDLWR